MTTYIDGKAVGVGTIRAEIGVTGVVLHDNTLVGNGNTEPLGVNTENIVSQQTLANSVSVLNTAIDVQAEAIQKTREDYIQADSEIHQMINSLSAETTTIKNNQASLGTQVANIEHKIPDGTTGTNSLINKQILAQTSYTKAEVDAKVSSVYKFKGSVSTYNSLPSTATTGDVYNVDDTGANYAWDGSKWDKLSETIDLTAYATTAYVEAREQDIRSDLGENINEVATAVSEKQDKLTAGSNITIEDNVISVEEAHVYTPTVPTVDLQDKSIFNFTDDALATLSISVPEIINADFTCQVNFSSGATATAFTAPDTIKWAGDDIVSGAFVPVANKRYAILFYSDGSNLRAISQGVA